LADESMCIYNLRDTGLGMIRALKTTNTAHLLDSGIIHFHSAQQPRDIGIVVWLTTADSGWGRLYIIFKKKFYTAHVEDGRLQQQQQQTEQNWDRPRTAVDKAV